MTTTNLADDIFLDLRRRILGGSLAPGARLPPERDLADQYDTNRNTLREAIRKLEQSRLVRVRQGQGVTVCEFRRTGTIELLAPFLEHAADDEEKLRVLYDVLPGRIQLIEVTLACAARRATPDDHVLLQRRVTEQLAAFDEGDVRKLERAHHHWLDTLVDAAHSIPIRWVGNSLLEAAEGLFDRFPNMWLLEPTFPAYQREVMKALLARDGDWAVTAARSYHVRVDRALHDTLGALLASRSASAPAAASIVPAAMPPTPPPPPRPRARAAAPAETKRAKASASAGARAKTTSRASAAQARSRRDSKKHPRTRRKS